MRLRPRRGRCGSQEPQLKQLFDRPFRRTLPHPKLDATADNLTRVCEGLEGSWRMALDGDATPTPRLALGWRRRDLCDAETRPDGLAGPKGSPEPRGGGVSDTVFGGLMAWDPSPSSDRGLSMRLRQTVGASASDGMDAPFGRETLARACGQRQRRGEPAFRGEDRRRDVGVRRPLNRLAGDWHRHPADGAVLAAAAPREIAMAIYGAKWIAAEWERDGWMCSRVRRRIERSTGLMKGGVNGGVAMVEVAPRSLQQAGRPTPRTPDRSGTAAARVAVDRHCRVAPCRRLRPSLPRSL